MKKYIAYCTDEKQFLKDKLLSYDYAKRFPGCLVLYYLKQLISPEEFEIHSGDIILQMVQQKQVNIKDVLLMQDANSKLGLQLSKLGAIKFHISCYESPLYAPKFYKQKKQYVQGYFSQSCYPTFQESVNANNSKNQLNYFPSYDLSDLDSAKFIHLKRSNRIALIATNKFLPFSLDLVKPLKPITWVKYIYCKYLYIINSEYRNANHKSLNAERLNLIAFFSKKCMLDVYGSGWNDLSMIPKKYRWKIASSGGINYLGPCESKIATLRQYQFSLIIENVACPGYITEKIIDSFIAQTIPIYLGAPDISKYFPKDIFIDASKFKNLYDLQDHINSLTPNMIIKMRSLARDFLLLKDCDSFSYQGMANEIHKKAKAICGKK